ncbi:ankyrin repeat domain-containing protein [bacterium]|nr:ankyrin repeat domain-containing protein [bacterium]
MNAVTQTSLELNEIKNKTLLEDAVIAYKKKEIDTCINYIIKGINQNKHKLSLKPQDKHSRKNIQKYWEFLSSTVEIRFSVDRLFASENKAVKARFLSVINAFITDNFIEKEWRQQCLGKFGGEKPLGISWKDWYQESEELLDSMNSSVNQLKWAISLGHVNYIEFLLSQEDALNIDSVLFDYDATSLCRAIDNNQTQFSLYLIDLKSHVSTSDKFGWTPIHYAAFRGNIKVVRKLLEVKVPLNLKDEKGRTPLHLAILNENLELVKLLLKEGIKVNLKDKEKYYPIHYALTLQNVDVLKLLIDYGADTNVKDPFNRSLVHILAISNNIILLECLLAQDIKINVKDKFGRTAIHYAACLGNSNAVDLLLKHNASTSIQDKFNETPMLCAAFSGKHLETMMLQNTISI